MNTYTYTVTVKPDSNAFAAIQRFDPEVLIELEDGNETAETYTISGNYVLDQLLDEAPGLIEWEKTTQEEVVWLKSITGANREYWRQLFGEYGFAAVAAAFEYASAQAAARPDTYHAIKDAIWVDDFRSCLEGTGS